MGFRLNVKGQGEEILLEKESILDVKFLECTQNLGQIDRKLVFYLLKYS